MRLTGRDDPGPGSSATEGRIPPRVGSCITIGMPRSAAQSDFVVQAPPRLEDLPEPGPIGVGTAPVELPRALVRTPFASARATRLVMTFTFVVLSVLALLTLIGPHIPAGE
jgi:hypothetical protein